MDEAKLLEVAVQWAEQEGIEAGLYDLSTEEAGGKSLVHFYPREQGQKPAPGDFLTISIDKQTGIVQNVFHGK
jgi:hypothetical protein